MLIIRYMGNTLDPLPLNRLCRPRSNNIHHRICHMKLARETCHHHNSTVLARLLLLRVMWFLRLIELHRMRRMRQFQIPHAIFHQGIFRQPTGSFIRRMEQYMILH
uniref:(northern house mosquito) hypothetical protein n=1 Tax=Culex pipiens TaxID=7175 RepID=A0A8D8CTX4_CULPI